MVAVRHPVPTRMTVDEFLSWDSGDQSGRLWELVDGEPVAMAPGSQNHGALQGEIGGLIRDHLRTMRPDCRLIVTPGVVPHVRSNRNFRIPDLGVTCSPPSADLMVPDPVLLIEILSPNNEAATWRNVWAYTTVPSVAEILTVRSTRIEAELLRRLPDGSWPKEPDILHSGGRLTLTSIGLSIVLDAFYETSSLRS
jgi:Uma2 family endonuclease